MFPKRSRRSAWFTLGLVAAFVVMFSGIAALGSDPGQPHVAYSYDNLLRLHVIAHSDRPEDQRAKLLVRDALLAEMATWPAAQDRSALEATLRANRGRLEAVAERALRAAGASHGVRVEIGEFTFPEKRWGETLLPAGEYRAVRVVIGDGAGRNWWCVLFPPLCFVEDDLGRVRPARAEEPSAPALPGLAWAAQAKEPASDRAGKDDPRPSAPEASAAQDGAEEPGPKAVVWRFRLWESLSAGTLRGLFTVASGEARER